MKGIHLQQSHQVTIEIKLYAKNRTMHPYVGEKLCVINFKLRQEIQSEVKR